MQGKPTGERLAAAGVGASVWSYSLTEHGGITGREFLEYRRSERWVADGLQGLGRHYILTSGTREQMRVSCILMPLITKALVLSNERVFYAHITDIIRRLKFNDMPDVEILVIDGFNDKREREGDVITEERILVESLIREYDLSRRRIFTSGDKTLTNSTWWSEFTTRTLRHRNQEIEVREDGRTTNRN